MGRIKAFLLGGLIGAGAALILAPQAGEQTRAMVAEKAGALAGGRDSAGRRNENHSGYGPPGPAALWCFALPC